MYIFLKNKIFFKLSLYLNMYAMPLKFCPKKNIENKTEVLKKQKSRTLIDFKSIKIKFLIVDNIFKEK